MTDNSLENQNLRPPLYYIDPALAEEQMLSLSDMVAYRMCYLCKQNYTRREFTRSEPNVFINAILLDCSKQADFLLPDTPLKEAIFRVLLANGPMTAERISILLNDMWAMSAYPRNVSSQVIERLLESSSNYCIGPATEQAVQVWQSLMQSAENREKKSPNKKRSDTPSKARRDNKKLNSATSVSEAPDEVSHSTEVSTYKFNPVSVGDPFKPSSKSIAADALSELSDRYNKLLFWLSAVGEGNRETFIQACLTLGVINDREYARSALRRLRLLGHVDCSGDGSRWEVSPAALVIFSNGLERGFLTGQRVPSLLNNLSGDLSRTHQPNYQGPPRVAIVASGSLASIADAGQTATKLAKLLPDIEGWKDSDSLQQMSRLITTQFDIKIWDGRQFQPCDTFYERDGEYYGQSGMYQLSRNSNGYAYEITLFFDEQKQRWLRGDWYGLRFLTLNAEEVGTEAVHDSSTDSLFVPVSQRWPMLYERALVLASGLLPDYANNQNWLRYQAIPFDLAHTLCSKLNVRLRQEVDSNA